MTPEEFFAHDPLAMQLFTKVRGVIDAIDDCEMRISKTQLGFRRRIGFAWVWCPSIVLKRRAAPLILSIGLTRYDLSSRWMQVAEARRGRFTHHLELYDDTDIDDEVIAWLHEAWEDAG